MLEISGLIKIMEQLNSLIGEMKSLVDEQLQALKQDDLEKIAALTGRQEALGHKIADLEEQRQQIIDEYAGIIEATINSLSDLQPHINDSHWNEIKILRDAITQNSQAIKRTNELNTLLLKQGLKYAEKMLSALNPQKPLVYGKSGSLSPGNAQTIVDTNV